MASAVDGVTGAPGGRPSELDAVRGARLLRPTGLLLALVSWIGLFATPALADTLDEPAFGYLSGVACSSATRCVAVGGNDSGLFGYFPPSSRGVVVPITNGTAGAATPVAGTQALHGVSCMSATSCVAVGENSSGDGVVVPITDGIPGVARTVAQTGGLYGVACTSATSCVAVGENGYEDGVVLAITNGTPGAATTVAETAGLGGVACTSANNCLAGSSNRTVGVLVPITNATPSAAAPVARTVGLGGMACASPTSCLAVGGNGSDDEGLFPASGKGVVVTITNGAPGAARTVAGTTRELYGVACMSATSCLAVGYQASKRNYVTYAAGVVVTITNGVPGATIPVAAPVLGGVACMSATSCLAVGSDLTGGVVVRIINGIPGAVTAVPGVSAYRLTNHAFVVAGGSTPKSGRAAKTKTHKEGTTFRYTLSEGATVKIVIARRRSGRRQGEECVAPTRRLRHAGKCIRTFWKGTLTRTSHQGANRVAFSGRITSHALTPGSYQATLSATDAAKYVSPAQTILFRISKR